MYAREPVFKQSLAAGKSTALTRGNDIPQQKGRISQVIELSALALQVSSLQPRGAAGACGAPQREKSSLSTLPAGETETHDGSQFSQGTLPGLCHKGNPKADGTS